MRKINILFVMPQMAIGGTENLVLNLAKRLDRNIFNPSISWFYNTEICGGFKELEIPLHYIPKKKRLDFSTMKKLDTIINLYEIHLVNAHHFISMVYAFYGCKLRNDCKLVFTEHSKWDIEKIPLHWEKLGRYMLKRTDATIGVSETIKECLQKKFILPSSKAYCIENGVDTSLYNIPNSKGLLKKHLSINENEKIIGMVANFRKVKNHILMLRAFNKLIKNGYKLTLLLIGQGFKNDSENSEPEIRKFIEVHKLHEKVLMLGYREDIPELLKIMDIFCLTSFKEGLPISLIEAMAAGLPVVVTDVEGLGNVVRPDENGFLVKSDNPDELQRALKVLITNRELREKMGYKSKELALRNYSLERCIRGYNDLFWRLTSG